jgi:hypothetical protein
MVCGLRCCTRPIRVGLTEASDVMLQNGPAPCKSIGPRGPSPAKRTDEVTPARARGLHNPCPEQAQRHGSGCARVLNQDVEGPTSAAACADGMDRVLVTDIGNDTVGVAAAGSNLLDG